MPKPNLMSQFGVRLTTQISKETSRRLRLAKAIGDSSIQEIVEFALRRYLAEIETAAKEALDAGD